MEYYPPSEDGCTFCLLKPRTKPRTINQAVQLRHIHQFLFSSAEFERMHRRFLSEILLFCIFHLSHVGLNLSYVGLQRRSDNVCINAQMYTLWSYVGIACQLLCYLSGGMHMI